MVDLTRRFFLGGAISLIAVTTSGLPKRIGNMPQIWGDGWHDDTGGISALFRSEPVILPKDKLTIDSHKGITFHRGVFKISQTLEIPDDCDLTMEAPTFRAPDLDRDAPFFRAGPVNGLKFSSATEVPFSNVIFLCQPGHGPLVHIPSLHDSNDRKRGASLLRAENGDVYSPEAAA